MKLPITFNEFKNNPIAAVAFSMLLAVGYLYIDLRKTDQAQIEKANAKIDTLDAKIDKLSYALKRSDSCLASAMTEIRIMQTIGKL